jgi:hypothetical protein
MAYIRESSPKPNSSKSEQTRKQHDRTATSVGTQQYSSANFVSLRFKSYKVKFGTGFKIIIISGLTSLKSELNLKLRKPGSTFAAEVGDLRQGTDPLNRQRKAPRLTDGIIQHIDKYLLTTRRWGSKPRRTDRPSVSCNITLKLPYLLKAKRPHI